MAAPEFPPRPFDVLLDDIIERLDEGIAEVDRMVERLPEAAFREASADAQRMRLRLLDLRARATELR